MTSDFLDDRPFLFLRVLVADHLVSINESLTALLCELDGVCAFGCTQNPDKVLALVQAERPDVVILDLQVMEPMDLNLLRNIKSIHDPPCVIVLSQYDIPPLQEASMSAGADYYLNKTSDCAHIPELVQKLQQAKITRLKGGKDLRKTISASCRIEVAKPAGPLRALG
jgi:two-component system, NarL family, response regulator DevR